MEAANIIESREDELARLMALEAGKPMKEARMEVGRAASIFRYYGSEGWRMPGIAPPSARPGVSHTSVREPLGVVGLITPWNFPLAIPTWKMAPALICGNTIVMKPASNASLNAAALVRILAEAGLPDGVLNMVTGPGGAVGDALVTDPRVKGISFTGSTSVGLGIQGRAVGKKVQLEMGGKNPYVVMEDADLSDAAAEDLLWRLRVRRREVHGLEPGHRRRGGLRRVHRGAQERDRGHEGRRPARRGARI